MTALQTPLSVGGGGGGGAIIRCLDAERETCGWLGWGEWCGSAARNLAIITADCADCYSSYGFLEVKRSVITQVESGTSRRDVFSFC